MSYRIASDRWRCEICDLDVVGQTKAEHQAEHAEALVAMSRHLSPHPVPCPLCARPVPEYDTYWCRRCGTRFCFWCIDEHGDLYHQARH